MECPNCGKKTIIDRPVCPNCGFNVLEKSENVIREEINESGEGTQSSIKSIPTVSSQTGGINFLRFLSILYLLVSISGSIWIISEFSTVTTISGYLGLSTEKQINPIGIAVGISVLFQGITTCVLLNVIATAAENIMKIGKIVSKKSS